MSASNDELLQLVTDCEEREGRLSDWERGFVSNIRSTLEAGRSLTEKQTERLDEVWEKATAKG